MDPVTIGLVMGAVNTGVSLFNASKNNSLQAKQTEQRNKQLEQNYQRQKSEQEKQARLRTAQNLSTSYFNLLTTEESKKRKSLNEYSTYY